MKLSALPHNGVKRQLQQFWQFIWDANRTRPFWVLKEFRWFWVATKKKEGHEQKQTHFSTHESYISYPNILTEKVAVLFNLTTYMEKDGRIKEKPTFFEGFYGKTKANINGFQQKKTCSSTAPETKK